MSSQVYQIIHTPGQHNTITLNDKPFCNVFDDRWKSGRLDPRTWKVRLNQGTFTLLQIEFLNGSHDVICTLHDTDSTELKRKGVVKKQYVFSWRDQEFRWSKRKDGKWVLANTSDSGSSDEVLAEREDTGGKKGLLSTVVVYNPSGLPSYPDTLSQAQAQAGTSQEKAGAAAAAMQSGSGEQGSSAGQVGDGHGLPDILMLGTALSIESASIDGGVLTSRPPTGTRSFGFAVGGSTIAVSTGTG